MLLLQDVYTAISKLVQKRVRADAEAGVLEAQVLLKSTSVSEQLGEKRGTLGWRGGLEAVWVKEGFKACPVMV